MRHRARLVKLHRHFDSGTDQQAHWIRVCTERLAALERFLVSVPKSHRKRVDASIGDVESRLLVAGPAWAGEDAPSLLRWAMIRAAWGDNHPYNRTRPDPLPVPLLDLFLNFPGAELGNCPACEIPLPFTPASGQFGVPFVAGGPYVKPRSIAETCPVCKVTIPQPVGVKGA